MKLIGLADCNSFYASCEKAFRPDLTGKPVVVLSNNDGCIVALSKEAKELGIVRGVPYFKVKSQLNNMGVSVFSSNYTLYQDMSDRIMEFLKTRTLSIEIYSIDESFFHIPEMSLSDATEFAKDLTHSIKKSIGMPVSIGMARTKTLSKIANHFAKKHLLYHVISPENEKQMLSDTPIDEVWGIGYRTIPKLISKGIKTALDLIECDDEWILKNLTICGLRTVEELRGNPCIKKEDPARQSFTSSISFPKPISNLEEINTAVACHCSTVCNKLYSNKLKASDFAVQLITDRFNPNGYNTYGIGHLDNPTCYTPKVIELAKAIVSKTANPNSKYKSIRVIAWNTTTFENQQFTLFGADKIIKFEDLMIEAVEKIGRDKIRSASQGFINKRDLANFQFLSPCYTTRWQDLPIAGRSDQKIS